MPFLPIDHYPQDEGSGIPRNATIWVQFNKTISSGTATYLTVSVASPDDSYVPVDGNVRVIASASGVADTMIEFSPEVAFDGYKRYGFFIAGGTIGIKSYDGEYLTKDLEYYFTTGSGTVDNPEVPATGIPAPSSYIRTRTLEVIGTDPANFSTNISVSSSYIVIKFNDAISDDVNLYDYITFTNKDIM